MLLHMILHSQAKSVGIEQVTKVLGLITFESWPNSCLRKKELKRATYRNEWSAIFIPLQRKAGGKRKPGALEP